MLEAKNANLGICSERSVHYFKLQNEGEVGNFHGLMIKMTGQIVFSLTQPGLIGKVLKVIGMSNTN